MRRHTRACVTLAAAVAAGLGMGCGLSHTVDRGQLAEISIENKLLLFDAENDVSIAIDEKESLQRQIRDAKKDIRYAEDQLDDAGSDGDRYDAKGDDDKARIAYMAQDVFDLKLDYLDISLDVLRERLVAQDGLILVAIAKYELAKAKLVKKNNVRGASDIELADFEDQVSAAIDSARGERDALAEAEERMEGAEGSWRAAREQLEEASGGGVGSTWAEDGSLWGGR